MHILITGAAGMLGRKVTARLAAEGRLGSREIARLTLLDQSPPPVPAGWEDRVEARAADIAGAEEAGRVAAARPDVILHLASIVSGEAEADFEAGYRVNLDGSRLMFEAILRQSALTPYSPRVVFSSSIAVYGAPLPERIDDTFALTPLTSYGTQKAIVELLLADYSRRGFMDGIGVRLPTICVRPGKPNRAASGFFSNIMREPLAGQEAVLPVGDEVTHWHASPRAAVGFLLHAATLDTAPMGGRRSLNMPGLRATVGEQIEALRRVGGDAAVRLIRREPDPVIARIVAGWPSGFDPQRAVALGFRAESSFDEILRVHMQDELGR